MTWGFFFLAALLAGLILTVVLVILESLPKSYAVALPRAELLRHRRQVHVARLGVGLATFGAVGLALVGWGRWPWYWVLPSASAVGVLLWLACHWLMRLPCQPSVAQQRATVIREIPPGGYGQVRLEGNSTSTVLAAQGEGGEGIPAGSEVEVVDCQRSVVVVRRIIPQP
ncbi:MAG: hypothetical protein NZ869_02245 [Thermoanaerobaculum sp.]|nr:hypothetical protein [Thermoanaerobaculum sp.]MDW7968353.1 hypothetical protein [Thermoanaerobaculum sp.]